MLTYIATFKLRIKIASKTGGKKKSSGIKQYYANLSHPLLGCLESHDTLLRRKAFHEFPNNLIVEVPTKDVSILESWLKIGANIQNFLIFLSEKISLSIICLLSKERFCLCVGLESRIRF